MGVLGEESSFCGQRKHQVQHCTQKVKGKICSLKSPVVQHQKFKWHKGEGRTDTSCSSTEVAGIKPDSKKMGETSQVFKTFN